jgi:transcriptional regulator with XRE-family HTH domain
MAGELHRRLGDNVRAIRLARGLSQEELAETMGYHRTYVGAIERAERNPSLGAIEGLAEGLGVAAETLLCTAPVMPSSSARRSKR